MTAWSAYTDELIPKRSVAAVEPAHDGLPLRLTMVALHEALELLRGLLAHLRRRHTHLLIGRLHAGLHLGDTDQIVHQHDGLANRLTAGEEPVIAQDQNVVLAQVASKALALIEIDCNTLEIVIADAIVE